MADGSLNGEQLRPSGASSADDAKIELLGDYLDAWLASIASTVRPTTIAGYSGLVRDHLAPELGHIALNDLTPLRVSRFLTELLESDNRREKARGGLSPRTVRACHQLLRRAVADALAWGLVERNVVALIRPPRNRVSAPRTWSADELRRVLGACTPGAAVRGVAALRYDGDAPRRGAWPALERR